MATAAQEKRQRPMQVLCLGFARTGTTSMKSALEILLQAPCYHAFEIMDNIHHAPYWNAALDAKFYNKGTPFTTAEQWDQILAEYVAVADLPSICFAEELLAAYPDAKVVLVQRDVERWYKSFDDNIAQNLYATATNVVAKLDPWFLGPLASVHHRWATGWMGASSLEEMQRKARVKYLEHYDHVRKVTPKERLLEYELGSGWAPLCEFLGIEDIPDVAFPRVNESAAMEKKMQAMVQRGIRSAAAGFLMYGVPLAAAAGAWWWFESA